MRAKICLAGSAILSAGVMLGIAAAQSPSPNSSASSPAHPQTQALESSTALPAKMQMVTVDVVATDSHGNMVRDLAREDFEVSDPRPQKISQFKFAGENASSGGATPGQPHRADPYRNQAVFERLTIPPTVVLLDALNSEDPAQKEARHNMVGLLKTLPPNTPVAVFLLGKSFTAVQDFSSDPALLRAALEGPKNAPARADSASEDSPQGLSLVALGENGGREDYLSGQIKDFEKQDLDYTLSSRVGFTLNALRNIAGYLSGYPGRKNLIWVSAAFPISLEDKPAVGKDAFGEARAFGEVVRQAAEALADAQVAIYPLDARVAATEQSPHSPPPGRGMGGMSVGMSSSIARGPVDSERTAHLLTGETMDELAESTGGAVCKNAKDLAGCIEGAGKDSLGYYELSYSPQEAGGDASFRKISLKVARPGVKLSYRHGYFVENGPARAGQEPAEQQLQGECRDFLPSTAIPLEAQVVPRGPEGGLTYLLSVPARALDLAPTGPSNELGARTVLCEYGGKVPWIQFMMMKAQTPSAAAYHAWQEHGFQEYVDVPPMADTGWVRIAVLNTRTGITGAVDIPMRAEDLAKAAAPPVSTEAASEGIIPAVAENTPSVPVYTIAFHSSSGEAGALDWNGDALVFQSSIGVAQIAPAYFHDAFGAKFHCEAGELIPRDASGDKPNLHLTFKNPSGEMAEVNLAGSEPQYSGDLPVDPSAKRFFERLWYLCHCRAAPSSLAAAHPN